MDNKYDWWYIAAMKRIAAAKFKEQCLSLLDRLGPEGLIADELIAATSVVHSVPLLRREVLVI